MFGFGKSKEDKEIDAILYEFQSIMRTADGLAQAEAFALATLHLTKDIRESTKPTIFVSSMLNYNTGVSYLAGARIYTDKDYFCIPTARNLQRAFVLYGSLLAIDTRRARHIADVLKEFFVAVAKNADIVLSQGGTGFETVDEILDRRSR